MNPVYYHMFASTEGRKMEVIIVTFLLGFDNLVSHS